MGLRVERPMGLSRDPDHRYFWRDQFGTVGPLPSVTRVVGLMAIEALPVAAARSVATSVVRDLEGVARLVEARGTTAAIDKLAGIPRLEWNAKGALGTRVHQLAEAIMRGREVHPIADEVPFLEGFRRFIDRWQPRPIALEEMVAYEDEAGIAYAGTLDAILEIRGETWLVDIKTGSSIHDEIALQLAAYGFASWAGRENDLARYEVPLIERYGVIHLRPELPEGHAFVPYQVGRAEWRAFMALLETWEWTRSPKAKRERLTA